MKNLQKKIYLFGIAAICVCLFISCFSDNTKQEFPKEAKDCADYVLQNYMTPESYVIEKFKDHDAVILGEYHRIKHDPLLVQKLIPLLYENGIYTVAIEFALYEDQPLIDVLVTASEYDEKLAQKINLNAYVSIGLGGYHEYCDIFKAAWKLNASLPPDSKKMRILGINDVLDWSLQKTEADRNNPEIRKKIFRNFSEKNWADRVKTEVLDRGEKVLCYCGIHHAFSKYRQPIADVKTGKFIRFVDLRFGNALYEKIKDKVFTISLHCPWVSVQGYDAPYVLPVDGVIDYAMALLPKENRHFGVDMASSPFGLLKSQTSYYKYGYEPFMLKNFCDGYICQGPFTEYEGVTPIKDFINEDNIEYAKEHLGYPFNQHSINQMNEGNASDTQIKRHHLKSVIEAVKDLYK